MSELPSQRSHGQGDWLECYKYLTWVNFLLTALLVCHQGYRDDGDDVHPFRGGARWESGALKSLLS